MKIVRKRIPTQRSVAFLQLWPNGWIKIPLGKEESPLGDNNISKKDNICIKDALFQFISKIGMKL